MYRDRVPVEKVIRHIFVVTTSRIDRFSKFF